MVRLRYGSTRPGEAAGYAVSLPGMVHHRDGSRCGTAGRRWTPGWAWATLRRRWRAGRPGAPPAAADFTGAETGGIFGYAAERPPTRPASSAPGPARTRPPTSPGPPPTC